MSRDPRKLRVFQLADRLVLDIYSASKGFPVDERYGLRAQLRRAAVSAASNIVEGSARRSTREYLSFLNIAAGSACEVQYLVSVAHRLGFMAAQGHADLEARCGELARGLFRLIDSLESTLPKPKA